MEISSCYWVGKMEKMLGYWVGKMETGIFIPEYANLKKE
jgi:hypothetical protein